MRKPVDSAAFAVTQDPPAAVLEYFARRHAHLREGYRDEDGYMAACSLVAFDVAEELLAAGRLPQLLSVRGIPIRMGGWIGSETLVPLPFRGSIEWGGHVVCECDGLAYDPMLARPVPVAEYAESAFGAVINLFLVFTTDEILETLRRERERSARGTP